MTSWNDLPDEMKFEIFEYLSTEERLKFAKCSFGCFEEVLNEEKNIERVALRTIQRSKGTIFVLTINLDFEVTFNQIGNICEVEHRGEFVWRTIGNSQNIAYEIFENILVKSKNNLEYLEIYRVDYMIRDGLIDKFPRVKTLDLATSQKDQLYLFLSKAENVGTLYVDIDKLKSTTNTENIRFSEDFKWPSIEKIRLDSNAGDVALDILYKLETSEVNRFREISVIIADQNISDVNQRMLNIFRKANYLRTNLSLTDDQFLKLNRSHVHLEFNASKIRPSTIVGVVSRSLRFYDGLRSLKLTNVQDGIFEFRKKLNFVQRKNASWPHYSDYETDVFHGIYDRLTGDLQFDSFGMHFHSLRRSDDGQYTF